MEPQNIIAACVDSRLSLQWTVLTESKAHIISVAYNNEFTKTVRSFVVPPKALDEKDSEKVPTPAGAILEVGPGYWFYRVGNCIGNNEKGQIHWSGIYGPIHIASSKDIIPLENNPYEVIHTQSIVNGYRIFTSRTVPSIVIGEVCKTNIFPASDTKWYYTRDYGRGNIEIYGMDHINTYSVRFSIFSDGSAVFPTDSILSLTRSIAFHNKRSARPPLVHDSTEKATNTADKTILKDLKRMKTIRFASHEDYLRFKAASEKVGEEKRKVY